MRALELPNEMIAKLRQLEDLSEMAEAGDKKARRELRQELRAVSPEIVAECTVHRIFSILAAISQPSRFCCSVARFLQAGGL